MFRREHNAQETRKKKLRRRQRRRRADKINKMENVECINVISNFFFLSSLLFMARFERVRVRVTINTHYRIICFFHPFPCRWKKMVGKSYEQSGGQPNREDSIGRRRILPSFRLWKRASPITNRFSFCADVISLHCFHLDFDDDLPANANITVVCSCARVCVFCVVSSLFDRIYVYHDSHKMSLCNVWSRLTYK